jgi:hypothetical protein
MVVDFSNIHLSKAFYEHDCMFSGFVYNYDKRTVEFEMVNPSKDIVQLFRLEQVILFQMQGCSFWHGGNSVYHICCYSKHPFLQQLEKIKQENINLIDGSFLDGDQQHIVFELQINSGDVFLAVCKNVSYSKQTGTACMELEKGKNTH